MPASVSHSVPQPQAFSLNVSELLSMEINPTKFSSFSKDFRKKLSIFNRRRLAKYVFLHRSLKRHLQCFLLVFSN